MRPGTNSCGCSQGEGQATAIVDSSGYFRRERKATSPAPLTTADVSSGRVTPATGVSVNEGSGPAELESSEVSSSPSIGREGSDRVLNEDAQESPVPSPRETETGEAITLPVLGGREAARLKWTAEGPTETVEGRTRGDARLSLPGKWGWRLCLRVLFFLWLMIHM